VKNKRKSIRDQQDSSETRRNRGKYVYHQKTGFMLWCLTPPSAIFQLYRGGFFSFIGGRNRSIRRKPSICHKSLTSLKHIYIWPLSNMRKILKAKNWFVNIPHLCQLFNYIYMLQNFIFFLYNYITDNIPQ
jgi:hypothetical protein